MYSLFFKMSNCGVITDINMVIYYSSLPDIEAGGPFICFPLPFFFCCCCRRKLNSPCSCHTSNDTSLPTGLPSSGGPSCYLPAQCIKTPSKETIMSFWITASWPKVGGCNCNFHFHLQTLREMPPLPDANMQFFVCSSMILFYSN